MVRMGLHLRVKLTMDKMSLRLQRVLIISLRDDVIVFNTLLISCHILQAFWKNLCTVWSVFSYHQIELQVITVVKAF